MNGLAERFITSSWNDPKLTHIYLGRPLVE
jgi:hypothetical protein